VIYRWWDCKI